MSDEQRSGRARGQLSADDPSAIGTTIVGGQPPGAPRQPLRAVPVGIEKVLYTAAIDPVFREALLRDREAAVRARGFALQPSELSMLRLAPAAQLASAIAALDTSETSLARRGFMRAVAGAVTLAAGTVLTGCDDKGGPSAGILRNDGGRDFVSAGVRDTGPFRDWPSAGIDPGYRRDGPRGELPFRDGPMPAGIRPDELGVPDGMKTDGAKKTDGK